MGLKETHTQPRTQQQKTNKQQKFKKNNKKLKKKKNQQTNKKEEKTLHYVKVGHYKDRYIVSKDVQALASALPPCDDAHVRIWRPTAEGNNITSVAIKCLWLNKCALRLSFVRTYSGQLGTKLYWWTKRYGNELRLKTWPKSYGSERFVFKSAEEMIHASLQLMFEHAHTISSASTFSPPLPPPPSLTNRHLFE